MSLIVEDGSEVANANTYVDLDFVTDYCTDLNYTEWALADVVKQQASVLKAMRYIESFYFIGVKNQTTNSLEWPRDNAIDRNGILIASDSIPVRIKNAVCESAYLDLVSPDSLQPFISKNGLKREEYGDVKFEYFRTVKTQPSFSIVSGLLSGLTMSSSTLMRA